MVRPVRGGNVYEWEETSVDLMNGSSSSVRGIRGGSWGDVSDSLRATDRIYVNPTSLFNLIGFRVASIPEPSTGLLGVLASLGMMVRRRR